MSEESSSNEFQENLDVGFSLSGNVMNWNLEGKNQYMNCHLYFLSSSCISLKQSDHFQQGKETPGLNRLSEDTIEEILLIEI
jgi:hypothetical protein